MMKIPNATYRIQLNSAFGFRDVTGVLDYLADLGAFWIYASPIFKARRKSAHGYDTVDPNRLNPELGTDSDFDDLITGVQKREMGWLQDVVPNHMAYTGENALLADLFSLGENSRFFPFFDICWAIPHGNFRGRVTAPFLGNPLTDCLERREIALELRQGCLGVAYYDHFFPLRLSSYGILDPGESGLETVLPKGTGNDLRRIIAGLAAEEKTAPSLERDDRIREHRKELQDLVDRHSKIWRFVFRRLSCFDLENGKGDGVGSLQKLLSDQVYRLRYWRTATREINYRRFFDINELICLRQEDPDVFHYTHGLLRRLVREKKIDGLRIDHVDGLRFPEQYLKRLRKTFGEIYLAVEKILGPEEPLPPSWPVQGTTGYGFADRVTRLFCRLDALARLDAVYRAFSGKTETFAQVCRNAKKQVLTEAFAGDLANLGSTLQRAAEASIRNTATDTETLKTAAMELLIRFPVYRTYISPEGVFKRDAELIRQVVLEAASARPDLQAALHLIQDVLLLKSATRSKPGKLSPARLEAAARFQQLCAPLAAKGVEDTALYRFHRLTSLNEVGGDPNRVGISRASFHAFLTHRAQYRPHAMNALSSHDSKRLEDVRARISVLSEIPDQWRETVMRWRKLNRSQKEIYRGAPVPDTNTEYLLYQTLLGTHPFLSSERDRWNRRIRHYMVKAAREAKVHTSWLKPDQGYEDALCRFIDRLLKGKEENRFLKEFRDFAKKTDRFGAFNSLSQTLIKITAPGFPDFYQGTELFNFSLVDPDNRRSVDFNRRKKLLETVRNDTFPHFHAGSDDKEHYDRMKLHLIYRALQTRGQQSELFQKGAYRPLDTTGRFAPNVIAFARTHQGRYAVIIVPRWLTDIISHEEDPYGNVWGDTAVQLPETYPTSWLNTLSGKTDRFRGNLPLPNLFERFPAALLMGEKTP
ncbi:MAG: malto-oligosyltrehalose synthase [Deltaproteobacteria bacterium]|nr:malto-oligosyltrehalose synthase [Deltaproteobacteria bacterium]